MKILDLIRGSSNPVANLTPEARIAAQKFDDDEIHVLRKTWQDLADRSNGKGIDKETFLQYFPLHGLLGDRLFAQFDIKKKGYIDFEEFITGLSISCRGSMDERIHFVFKMYDVSHDNTVSKAELTTLLNHIPKETFTHYYPTVPLVRATSNTSLPPGANPIECTSDSEKGSTNGEHPQYDAPPTLDIDELDYYTNQDVVERAFAECDIHHEGRLNFEEFKMWIERNPSVMEYLESNLPYSGLKDAQPHSNKKETLPHVKRIASRASLGRTSIQEVAGEIFNHSSGLGSRRLSRARLVSGGSSTQLSELNHGYISPSSPTPAFSGLSRGSSFAGQPLTNRVPSISGHDDPEETVRLLLIQAMELTQVMDLKQGINSLLEKTPQGGVISMSKNASDVYRTVVTMEAYLWKKGKSLFHMLSKRYYLLSGNCMYYYTHQDDVRPKGVIFLTGSIIERFKDEEMEIKGYFGFEIIHQDLCTGDHHRHEKRVIYCRSEDDRDKWVSGLQHAAHVVPIEDDYVIGKELGRGRFSVVCECVHKVTGVHCAVKIIDKSTIEPEEKSLLRTEIAVLKLVNHPNIIRLEGLYESKTSLYIVMEMLKGGELFERIVGRPRFTEYEAAKLMRPLLESVAYIHDLGIVHRDLKPENILCGDELDDLKIADFGLSKMILPKEKMDAACGTLSYVAPEVLTMQGYGKEADLWSVGVILFLILCGKLPFDGEDHNEIIRSTIQADLKVNPNVWAKLSDDAKSLITSLLNKNPKERITARESLKHPFIVNNAPPPRRLSVTNFEYHSLPLALSPHASNIPSPCVTPPLPAHPTIPQTPQSESKGAGIAAEGVPLSPSEPDSPTSSSS